MGTNRRESEAKYLGRTEEMLSNADSHPKLVAGFDEYSYTAEVRAEGKELHAIAFKAYHDNRKEHDEESETYAVFENALDALEERYLRDRKKGRTVFKREQEIKHQLLIDVDFPNAYQLKMDTMFAFYNYFAENEPQLSKMGRMKFTGQDVHARLEEIASVKNARAIYLQEKGEAQDATIAKDEAMTNLDIWISDFLDVAEIAFEEHPQLLEMLGIVVKR